MYLITNREKAVTPESIAETLWPDQQYANPNGAVKNLIHRLRQKLCTDNLVPSNSVINNAHGCYNWNSDYPYWLDIEEFEKFCREAASLSESDPEAACGKYSQALNLYGGDYLPES